MAGTVQLEIARADLDDLAIDLHALRLIKDGYDTEGEGIKGSDRTRVIRDLERQIHAFD